VGGGAIIFYYSKEKSLKSMQSLEEISFKMKHVIPLGHIILVPSQPIFGLTP
jgi:hypothetical protein